MDLDGDNQADLGERHLSVCVRVCNLLQIRIQI